jgi:hypothetical protein
MRQIRREFQMELFHTGSDETVGLAAGMLAGYMHLAAFNLQHRIYV